MKKREINDIEACGISLEIINLLDGLTIGQARRVLRTTESILETVVRADITSSDFAVKIQEYEAACCE
jgi:hypothetical protein